MSGGGAMRHVPEASRYEWVVDGQVIGVVDYRQTGDQIDLHHTHTAPAHRGHGIAAELVGAVLDDLRARGLRVVPNCWYVARVHRCAPRVPRPVGASEREVPLMTSAGVGVLGADSFLRRVHDAGLVVVLASSASEEDLADMRAVVRVDDAIDAVVTADDLGTSKPDPEIFAAARDKADIDPARVLAVGDSAVDEAPSVRSSTGLDDPATCAARTRTDRLAGATLKVQTSPGPGGSPDDRDT